MSGHSKWAQIKRKKGVTDDKRGKLFSKLSRFITIAAKSSGNPDMNEKLRLAMDQAKRANMPADNIDRAIKRGTGEIGGEAIEELTYEAYGPGKVAIVINVLTDNKNRTLSETKRILEKNGGHLADQGSVTYLFASKAVITLAKEDIDDQDSLELTLIDAGAEDVQEEADNIIVYAQPAALIALNKALGNNSIEHKNSEINLVPQSLIELSTEDEKKTLRLLSALEDSEDVQTVYTNLG